MYIRHGASRAFLHPPAMGNCEHNKSTIKQNAVKSRSKTGASEFAFGERNAGLAHWKSDKKEL
jgi:hypothetical protein